MDQQHQGSLKKTQEILNFCKQGTHALREESNLFRSSYLSPVTLQGLAFKERTSVRMLLRLNYFS